MSALNDSKPPPAPGAARIAGGNGLSSAAVERRRFGAHRLDAERAERRGHGGHASPLLRASSAPEGGFTPGTVLAGRYRVVARLGQGGMGEVYRADDLKLGQPVALKFLPRPDVPELLERLYAEVALGRQVSHPNVCRLYDIVEFEGQTFLAMEYVDGEDLASLLARIGRLPADKALDIARDLCAGLAAIHEKGVIHRDLKPANVMIDGRGRARITDFGLAVAGQPAGRTPSRARPPTCLPSSSREARSPRAATCTRWA